MSVSYVPDPGTKDSPITADEVRAVAGAVKILRVQRNAEHFCSRVLATLAAHRHTSTQLNRQVQQMRGQMIAQGTGTGLSPEEAAKYLPPERINAMATGNLRAMIQYVEGGVVELQAAQRELGTKVNAVKFAVGTLLANPDIPQNIKEQLLGLLSQIPESAEVQTPQIDLPREEDIAAYDGAGTVASNTGPAPVEDDDEKLADIFGGDPGEPYPAQQVGVTNTLNQTDTTVPTATPGWGADAPQHSAREQVGRPTPDETASASPSETNSYVWSGTDTSGGLPAYPDNDSILEPTQNTSPWTTPAAVAPTEVSGEPQQEYAKPVQEKTIPTNQQTDEPADLQDLFG